MKTNNEVMNQVLASMLTKEEASLGLVYPKDSKMSTGIIDFNDETIASNKKLLHTIKNQYLLFNLMKKYKGYRKL